MSSTLLTAPSELAASEAADGTPGAPSAAFRELPRVLGRLGEGTPVLVCVAGIHGNEPSGVLGLRRVLDELTGCEETLRGTLVGLVGNREALASGRRYVERDLNRIWTASEIATAIAGEEAAGSETRELTELWRELAPLVEGPSPPIVLDLHSTSGHGPPFVVLEDTLANRAFGRAFPAPLVLGIEEELAGTLTHFLTARRVVNVGFEAGQHDDPLSVDRAAAAVWIALGAAGLLPPTHPEVSRARRWLADRTARYPAVVEVRGRHPLHPEDGFRMRPGFESFQTVQRGQILADDVRGEIAARADGLLLMPLYQVQGDDGFFLTRPVSRRWLSLSARVRRLRLDRVLHLLPGVSRCPDAPRSFRVDTRVARWLVPELFHLLGFRRSGPAGRILTMVRRHDG